MEGNARHAALVAFAWAVDVKVAEANDRRVRFRHDAAYVLVKQEFRVTVYIQRFFKLAGLNEVAGAAAVGGCGRGVQERNLTLKAVVQQLFGVLIVVIHHILTVPLGSGGASAFVEHGFNVAKFFTGHNLDQKIFFIHVVGDVQVNQVYELGAVFQVVDDQNIGNAFVIQRFHDVAANEASAAGNDNHNCNL